MAKAKAGFSLVELLVCIGIIGILAGMYLSSLSKAIDKAKGVAVIQAMRNGGGPPVTDSRDPAVIRQECRAAFRFTLTSQKEPIICTRIVRFVVTNVADFRAYWFTLIDPAASGPLKFDADGNLIAKDDKGQERVLYMTQLSSRLGTFPTAWEFLSTDLTQTSLKNIGTTVSYSDGHVEYIKFPGAYPACGTVAELSQRFLASTGT